MTPASTIGTAKASTNDWSRWLSLSASASKVTTKSISAGTECADENGSPFRLRHKIVPATAATITATTTMPLISEELRVRWVGSIGSIDPAASPSTGFTQPRS